LQMKIVVDANVFISGFIWDGVPGVVIDRANNGLDQLFITDDLVDEVERVLRKPKLGQCEESIALFITHIEDIGKKIVISPEYTVKGICRDPKDDMYLECALAAGADYIISGDRDLLDLKEYGGVKIVSARDYLDVVGG